MLRYITSTPSNMPIAWVQRTQLLGLEDTASLGGENGGSVRGYGKEKKQ